jgi:hypothetical protein
MSLNSAIVLKMLRGNIWTEGAPVVSNFVFLMGFFTLIMSAAQEDGMVVPVLDAFQTFLSWPSFNEGAILSVILWCFRNVERVLGSRVLLIFLAYNFGLFLPVFAAVVYFKSLHIHFSLFYFVPYSLFAYTVWHIPSTPLFSRLSDKGLLLFLVLIDLVFSFPYGFGPLVAGILGTVLWRIDLLRLKKLCDRIDPAADDAPPDEGLEAEAPADAERVRSLVEMGFSEAQAREALRASNGDVQHAIDALVGAVA